MDQYGAQGKSSGYKKYFQKYMGSGSGGYEQYMSVAGNGFGYGSTSIDNTFFAWGSLRFTGGLGVCITFFLAKPCEFGLPPPIGSLWY